MFRVSKFNIRICFLLFLYSCYISICACISSHDIADLHIRLTVYEASIAELRRNVKEAKMETVLERKKYNSKMLTPEAEAAS